MLPPKNAAAAIVESAAALALTVPAPTHFANRPWGAGNCPQPRVRALRRGAMPLHHAGSTSGRDQWFADSSLEQGRFELPVPPARERSKPPAPSVARLTRRPFVIRDREFESASLRYNKRFYLLRPIPYFLTTHANPQVHPHRFGRCRWTSVDDLGRFPLPHGCREHVGLPEPLPELDVVAVGVADLSP